MSGEPPRERTLEARALWFAAPHKAELRPERVPPPGRGEVRVASVASAVSHGTEMLVYRGEAPDELPLDLPTLAGGYSFPIKYGYATVGRVLDAGNGAEGLSPGDPVFVHHPHQDLFLVPAHMPVRLPEDLDPAGGVFFANLETALNIVHDAPLRFGEAALVFGQGVVGLLVTQLLKLSGAGCVISVDPLRERRELALAVGADEALRPDGDLTERVREATAGRGADVAVEVSGSGAALGAAVDAVADEGTVVVASWYGTKPVALDLGGHFHRGRVRLRSSQVGGMGPELAPRWDRARRTQAVLRLLAEPNKMRLEELVSRRVPFAEAPEAYELMDRDPGGELQVVFVHERC